MSLKMFTSVARKFCSLKPKVAPLLGEILQKYPHKITKQSGVCFCTNVTEESPLSDMRKVDITQGRQFLFDTYITAMAMQNAGIPKEQAQALLNVLIQITQAQLDHINKNLVTKPQQEIAFQQMMSHIASLRKDLIILEKSEFSQLKHDYETQHIELEQQKATLYNELDKLRGGVQLDLNLEKARAREDHGENEKRLAVLQNQMEIKLSEMNSVISRLDSKIDREIAQLIAKFERNRTETLRYMGGTVISCLGLCLGIYRLWLK